MTAKQATIYDSLRAAGWEYSHKETDGSVFLELREHLPESYRVIDTLVLPPDGGWYLLRKLEGKLEDSP